MNDKELLDYCNQRFVYSQETGLLANRISGKGISGKGVEAGFPSRGYRRVSIKGKRYLVHRIIFFMEFGYFPEYIDHINCIRSDNRISNLRACTSAENNRNRQPRKNASSKYKGVFWDHGNKWRAGIRVDGKQIYAGSFLIEEDAAKAYNTLAKKHFGEFAYINKVK
jgi:hypothetical protein